MNICFICTGNTCRSPMAEGILRAKNLPNVHVQSAGVHAMDGFPISAHAKTLLTDYDMPMTPTSQPVTIELVNWSHLILTMTVGHQALLRRSFPEASDKILTLKEFVIEQPSSTDVKDPFSGDLAIYEATFKELTVLIDELEKKITGGWQNEQN